MANRTLRQYTADILREVRGQATLFEARQALQDALNVIDASANWEFLITTKLININAPYSTGTVTVNAASTAVSLGGGGSWTTAVAPFGEYREIKFADRDLPYKISVVGSTSSLTLATALSGSTNISGGTYVMYQARYPLPTDCEPGRDLTLKGPSIVGERSDGNLPKRERMTYDRRTSEIQIGVVPLYYTDDEYDETNHSGTIRIEPYPVRDYEFRLTYYRKLTVPANPTDVIMIPEAFERAPILAASANILRKKNMQGWQQIRQEAADFLNKMYNRYAASAAYDGKIEPDFSELLDDYSSDIFGVNSMMYVRE